MSRPRVYFGWEIYRLLSLPGIAASPVVLDLTAAIFVVSALTWGLPVDLRPSIGGGVILTMVAVTDVLLVAAAAGAARRAGTALRLAGVTARTDLWSRTLGLWCRCLLVWMPTLLLIRPPSVGLQIVFLSSTTLLAAAVGATTSVRHVEGISLPLWWLSLTLAATAAVALALDLAVSGASSIPAGLARLWGATQAGAGSRLQAVVEAALSVDAFGIARPAGRVLLPWTAAALGAVAVVVESTVLAVDRAREPR